MSKLSLVIEKDLVTLDVFTNSFVERLVKLHIDFIESNSDYKVIKIGDEYLSAYHTAVKDYYQVYNCRNLKLLYNSKLSIIAIPIMQVDAFTNSVSSVFPWDIKNADKLRGFAETDLDLLYLFRIYLCDLIRSANKFRFVLH